MNFVENTEINCVESWMSLFFLRLFFLDVPFLTWMSLFLFPFLIMDVPFLIFLPPFLNLFLRVLPDGYLNWR